MTDTLQIDRAISAYRTELEAEARLARGDLDEIEDHMRSLIDELRGTGLTDDAAIELARRRLGEPKLIAREHARVRTPFGARLSRTRAWSAVALLVVPYLACYGIAETVVGAALMIALIARVSWARAVVLGTVVMAIVSTATALAAGSIAGPFAALQLGCCVGAFGFIVPWRRCELDASGLALVLIGPAAHGAATALHFQLTAPGGVVLGHPMAIAGTIAVIVAAIGVVMRARWSVIASIVAAVAIASTLADVLPLEMKLPHAGLYWSMTIGSLIVGGMSALIVGYIGWRTARSTLGTLRA